jgi:hypothetical protein
LIRQSFPKTINFNILQAQIEQVMVDRKTAPEKLDEDRHELSLLDDICKQTGCGTFVVIT